MDQFTIVGMYTYKWNYCASIVDTSPCEFPPYVLSWIIFALMYNRVAWFNMFGGTCVVIALLATQEAQLLNTADPSVGIALTYSGPQSCPTGAPGVALSFRLETECDPNTEYFPYQLIPYTSGQCQSIVKAKSKYACPKPGSNIGSSTSVENGLSTGSIICIVAACLVFVYVVGGMVINVRWKQRTGLDAFPHKTYWTYLGELVWAGTRWTFSKVLRRSMQGQTVHPYSQL